MVQLFLFKHKTRSNSLNIAIFLDYVPNIFDFAESTNGLKIDYREDIDGKISAFEFKWNPKRKATVPLSFARSYPDAEFKVVTRDNYEEFLL